MFLFNQSCLYNVFYFFSAESQTQGLVNAPSLSHIPTSHFIVFRFSTLNSVPTVMFFFYVVQLITTVRKINTFHICLKSGHITLTDTKQYLNIVCPNKSLLCNTGFSLLFVLFLPSEKLLLQLLYTHEKQKISICSKNVHNFNK